MKIMLTWCHALFLEVDKEDKFYKKKKLKKKKERLIWFQCFNIFDLIQFKHVCKINHVFISHLVEH